MIEHVISTFTSDDDRHYWNPYHLIASTSSSSPPPPPLLLESTTTTWLSKEEEYVDDNNCQITNCCCNGRSTGCYFGKTVTIVDDNSRDIHHQHLTQQQYSWTKYSFLERGTRVHVLNATLSILSILYFGIYIPFTSTSSGSKSGMGDDVEHSSTTAAATTSMGSTWWWWLCTVIFWVGFVGLAYDNVISGMGKYMITTNPKLLRVLTKYRFVIHSFCIPLFFIPITIVAYEHNLIISSTTATAFVVGSITMSVMEAMYWINYDVTKFVVIDLSNAIKDKPSKVAGTISYTLPDKRDLLYKVILPVIMWVTYSLIVGILLIWHRHDDVGTDYDEAILMLQSGAMLGSLSLVALLTSVVNRSKIQLLGEIVSLGLLWKTFQSL